MEVYWVLPAALNVPPPSVQLVAVAVAFKLVRLPPERINPGLVMVPRVRARVLPPLKMSVAEPDMLSTSPVAVYWVLPAALKVPPPTVQPLAVAVAFKLVRLPPLSTRPGFESLPRVRPRVLPPLNRSVAEPDMLSTSPVAVYWVLPVALNVPPPTVQPVAVAVALRLVRLPPLRIRPGFAADPRVRPSVLAVVPVPKTSLAVP